MTVEYIALNMIMQGPNGIMVPLGFESYMDITTARMYYDYIATILLVLIAATTGSRGEPAYCILIPIFAGVFTLFGWFSFAHNINAIASMIVAGILGIMIYMNETNHEMNGIAGPGSKLLNVVFFLILFQVMLGLLPGMGVFSSSATATPSYGQEYCPPSATCGSYSNVDVSTSMNTHANTGGFLSGAISVAVGAVTAFIGMLGFLVAMIINVVLSATVIGSLVDGIWPGVSSTPQFLAFMGLLSVIFWACDLIFIENVYLKLFPSEGSI
jgi:hypothetical protein